MIQVSKNPTVIIKIIQSKDYFFCRCFLFSKHSAATNTIAHLKHENGRFEPTC